MWIPAAKLGHCGLGVPATRWAEKPGKVKIAAPATLILVLTFLRLLSEALRCLRSLFSSFPFQSGVYKAVAGVQSDAWELGVLEYYEI